MSARLHAQIGFLLEIDKLKQVFRQTYLLDETRKENDAEHSWHFAMFAVMLAEYANEKVDLLKVVKMALVHDLVEIDAGDTFLYDTARNADKAERENRAADRIFGLLPTDVGEELKDLWTEFEARETPEARFAGAIDRLQPFLHNIHTDGRAWREHGINARQIRDRNGVIALGSETLWTYALALIDEAVAKNHVPAK
ncbi:MAG: HD domain-containing protein [bacterium]|jgi:putative hydrolases of HD superfamily|nr:HD domain-containing protein [bacterium]